MGIKAKWQLVMFRNKVAWNVRSVLYERLKRSPLAKRNYLHF